MESGTHLCFCEGLRSIWKVLSATDECGRTRLLRPPQPTHQDIQIPEEKGPCGDSGSTRPWPCCGTGESQAKGAYRLRRFSTISTLLNSLVQLHKRRFDACLKHPDLGGYYDLLHKANYKLASEDESGNDADDCVITNMLWRNPEITDFLRALDAVHLSSRFMDSKPTRGNWPRNRIPSHREDRTTDPIAGLPSNFYEPSWLASRSEFELTQLKVQPEVRLILSDRVKQ